MTTEEKLKHFLEITVKDVSTQNDALVTDYQNSLEQQFEEHATTAKRQSEYQIKVETDKAIRDVNIELSRQQLHIKRKITKKQTALKEQLFHEVNQLLHDYMQTDDYTELLVRKINAAKEYAGNQYVNIYIDPSDSNKKALLEERTATELKVSEYSFIGGIRTVIPYKNILIDDSFEKKLEEAKENFVFGGSSNE